MIEVSKETSHGVNKQQPDYHSHSSTISGTPTNIRVGSVFIQPNSPPAPRMGREVTHHSNPGLQIPSPASYGEPESGPTYIWVQCLDGHIISRNQLTSSRGTDSGVLSQHNEPTQPGTPFLPSTQSYNDAIGSRFYAQTGELQALLSQGSTQGTPSTSPHLTLERIERINTLEAL
ncbi:hypothetical protein FXO38_04506 [Capsicum annuum]|nr:hypothetical protein FXO37_20370 [Capsicum annuum]KAF3676016.1 hypothetical protein FXO38_04506 [Capsicum annuum]